MCMCVHVCVLWFAVLASCESGLHVQKDAACVKNVK